MSMLAERRRKQKWSLNPRGNDWSKDSNKFGQKLMERMGWKEGKGLGANEDGQTKHIHVSYKNDSKGIGFNESVEWSHQQDNFAALLDQLNNKKSSDESTNRIKSLEEKSEKSRARVHYRKFTRGKDLSRYTEKDLANILGRRKLNTIAQEDLKPESSNSSNTDSHTFGVNTTIGGSMIDYFKNKMPNLTNSFKNKNESESESETKHGFGFNTSERKNKKRKSDASDLENTATVKKSKNKISESKEDGFINLAFDPLSRNAIKQESHKLETIYECEEVSPKVKRKKTNNSLDVCNETSSSKTSKRKKSDDVQVQSNCEYTNNAFSDEATGDTTLPDNNTFEIKTKKSRKKKQGVENPCFNLQPNLDVENTELNNDFEVELKVKYEGVDNLGFCDNLSGDVSNTHTAKKKKSKSKPKSNIEEVVEVAESTKKSKSKSSKTEVSKVTGVAGGIDNPALRLDDSLSLNEDDLILNVTSEPSKSKRSDVKKNKDRLNDDVEYIFDDAVVSSGGVTDRRGKRGINKTDEAGTPRDNTMLQGLDNAAFNHRSNTIEEGINFLVKNLDDCQAEVENGINESKVKRVVYADRMIGVPSSLDKDDEPHPDGLIFRFQNANFSKRAPYWEKAKDVSVTYSKKSYKHLIQGDIVVGFRDTNLHKVNGYGKPFKKITSV